MNIVDLYKNLFGRSKMTDGSIIEMAEHGRVGGVSTGQPFKFVTQIDSTGATVTGIDPVANSLVPSQYDTIIINYVDSTKAVVSSYVFKLGSTTVSTITPTFNSSNDTYVKT